MTTESDRAREYRRKMEARNANKVVREKALRGSEGAFLQLWEDYSPLLPTTDSMWVPKTPTIGEDDLDWAN